VTVYVDSMKAPFGRMIVCHMFADTLAELHGMADTIGVARKWFQDREGFPHYDICQSKRRLAVAAGAAEVTYRDLPSYLPRIEGGRGFLEQHLI
jgi:hypothetical protein